MFFYSQGRPARVVAPPETQRPRDAPGRRAREGAFRFIRVSLYSSFFLFEFLAGVWTDGVFFYSQVTTQSRLRCLQHVSLLKSLSDDQRTTLVQLLQPKQYTEGEVVFNQGDAGDKFYIVETGNVAIHRRVSFNSRTGNWSDIVFCSQANTHERHEQL